MRKKIVAGNWKMNKTLQEGIELAKEVNSKVKAANAKDVKVIIGTPFIHLAEVSKLVDPAVVAVSAQNCATEVSDIRVTVRPSTEVTHTSRWLALSSAIGISIVTTSPFRARLG